MKFHRSALAVALTSIVALTACADDATGPAAPPADEQVAGAQAALTGDAGVRAIVVFEENAVPAGAIAAITAAGGVVTRRLDVIGVAFVTVPSSAALGSLRTIGGVSLVGTDRMTDFLRGLRVGGAVAGAARKIEPGQPTDPTRAGRWEYQWNMRQIQADRAWAAGYFGSPSIRVGILDTGIDYTNRELNGRVDLTLSTSISPEPVGPGEHPVMDYHFHGTHVGSSVVTNNITVAGVAPNVTLVGVKVLSAAGSGLFEWSIAGIVYAADQGVRILNMSLGAEVDGQADAALIESIRRAVGYAESRGAIVIAAAGNDGYDLDDPRHGVYVPCEVATVCVSATGPLMQQNFDQPAGYTNYGLTAIDVAAPGGNASDTEEYVSQDLILGACSTRTTQPTLALCRTSGIDGYYYAYAAGTSMAAPHVAGLAAMILSQSPGIRVHTLRNKILNHADDINEPGPDRYSNHGRINVFRSLTGR
jgi:lantibiotic leader peptide-processing serine protease